MWLWNSTKFDNIDCISRTDTCDDVIYLFTIELISRLQSLTMRDFKTQYMGKSNPLNGKNNSVIFWHLNLFVTKKKSKNKENRDLPSIIRLIVVQSHQYGYGFLKKKKGRKSNLFLMIKVLIVEVYKFFLVMWTKNIKFHRVLNMWF